LKITGLADLIQIFPCLQDIDTVLTGALFHKMCYWYGLTE